MQSLVLLGARLQDRTGGVTTGALYSTLLHALPQEARRTPQAGAAASIGKRNGHLPLPAALAREAGRG